jgi:perosamine synthetase
MLDATKRRISLSAPYFFGNELGYAEEAIRTGWVSYAGAFVRRLEASLADVFGFREAVVTCSGTTALQLALHVSDVRGCEVLVPELTFIAPVSAIVHAGGIPLFVDVDASDWQMDLNLMRSFLQDSCRASKEGLFNKSTDRRIKAICAVHLLGGLADLSELRKLADDFGLDLIEDAAEALGATFCRAPIGAVQRQPDRGLHLVTTSLNANKVITAGGGGCVFAQDAGIAHRVRHLAGTAKCDAIEYIHDEAAFNYRMSNVLAAVGLAQIECLEQILSKRRSIHDTYREHLADLPLSFMPETERVLGNSWLTTILFSGSSRPVLSCLLEKGVEARPLWVPMTRLAMFAGYQNITENRVADRLWRNALSLPNGSGLSEEDIGYVCGSLRSALETTA